MNLSLESAGIDWNNVDLELFSRGIRTVLVRFPLIQLFFDEILMDSYGLQPFLHVVNHMILLRFWKKFLGFHVLNQTRSGTHGFTLIQAC